jgi:hypothetical protein
MIGHGSKWEIGGPNSTDPYTEINGVNSADFGSNKVDVIDNTDMQTTGTTRTFEPGLENSGDLTIKYNVKPGDATQALIASNKGTLVYHKVIYPGAVRTRTFQGIILSADESIPDDKKPTGTVKIQISGPITNS